MVKDTLAGVVLESEVENESRETMGADEILEQWAEVLDDEGIHIAEFGDSESDEEQTDINERKQKRKRFTKDINIHEARALSVFITTQECRRKVWDLFFHNARKRESSVLNGWLHTDAAK